MNAGNKNLFVAMILSATVLVGWQYYFAPKQKAPVQKKEISNTKVAEVTKEQKGVVPEKVDVEKSEEIQKNLETYTLEAEGYKYVFRNDLSIVDIENKNTKYSFKSIVEDKNPLKIQVYTEKGLNTPLFKMKQLTPGSLSGYDAKNKITAKIVFGEYGKMKLILSSPTPLRYKVTFKSTKKEIPNRHNRSFMIFGEDVEKEEVGSEEMAEFRSQWFGIDFNYHIFAMILKKRTVVKYAMNRDGTFVIDTLAPEQLFESDIVFTKKDYDMLSKISNNLEKAVDFGLFGILALPILKGLQYSYMLIPNYGIAIIILTIILRMLTFPLQIKSFRSMKKMQLIQPDLQKIKEKFKDDPARVQKETMAFFKRSGTNPLSGCFPLLLQLPIFFAFYKVLFEAVELVEEPFFWWLQDLSTKDPYYVLPVLMTLAMLVQQKFMPNTSTDPTQKKIMMFMPVVFGFIFKDMPSGLCLYIFVSTLFGFLQQMFVYRTSN